MFELSLDVKVFFYMFGTGVLLYYWRRDKSVEQFIAEVLTLIAMLLAGVLCTLLYSPSIKP